MANNRWRLYIKTIREINDYEGRKMRLRHPNGDVNEILEDPEYKGFRVTGIKSMGYGQLVVTPDGWWNPVTHHYAWRKETN